MKRIILVTCGAFACTLFILLLLGGRDIPPPDTRDLELTFPDVPPHENAFTYYAEAFSQAQIVDDLARHDYVNFLPANTNAVDAFIATNASAIALIQKGNQRTALVTPRTTVTGDDPLDPLQTRVVTHAMQTMALRQIDRRELAEAAATCETLLTVSRKLSEGANSFVGAMVAVAISSIATDTTQRLLCDTDCSLEEIQQAQLPQALDFSLTNGCARGFCAEFARISASVDDPDSAGVPACLHAWPVIGKFAYHPNRTRNQLASHYRAMISCLATPATEERFPRIDAPSGPPVIKDLWIVKPNSVGYFLQLTAIPDLSQLTTTLCEKESRLRCLRAVIALRSYHHDHEKLPNALEELVPKYLDTPPIDPFDGQPLRYQPDQNRIYSIGEDLIDSDGTDDIAFPILREPDLSARQGQPG